MTDIPLPAPGDTSWSDWGQEQEDASDVVQSGRLSDTALRAAFAAAAIPSHAGPRGGRFDPTRSIYNLKASNTRRVRASLGAARVAAGLCRIGLVGDSLTAVGGGATSGVEDPGIRLRQAFARDGYPVGDLVHEFNNAGADSRLSWTGSWAGYGSLTLPYLFSSASGPTWSVTGTGTVLDIVTTGDSGAWTVRVDGGAVTTYTPTGVVGPKTVTITGLADTAHTAVFTAVGSTVLYAAGFRYPTGVVMENAGLSSSTTADWLGGVGSPPTFGPAWWMNHANFFDLDAVNIELGINDWFTSVPVATFKANLTTLVGQFIASGANVFLTVSQFPAGGETTWQPFASAIYDVADTADVPLLDLADRFGTFAQYNADGLGYDEASDTLVHLAPAGIAHKTRAWSQILSA